MKGDACLEKKGWKGKRPGIFQREHFLKQVSSQESEQMNAVPHPADDPAVGRASLPASAPSDERDSGMPILFPGQLPPRAAEGKTSARRTGPCPGLAWLAKPLTHSGLSFPFGRTRGVGWPPRSPQGSPWTFPGDRHL